MATLEEFFRAGGIWAYVMIPIALAASAVPLLAAIMGACDIRIPSVLWIDPACVALGVGVLGTGVGVGEALDAAENLASNNALPELLVKGGELALGTMLPQIEKFALLDANEAHQRLLEDAVRFRSVLDTT